MCVYRGDVIVGGFFTRESDPQVRNIAQYRAGVSEPCSGDLNGDGLVDDADFIAFAAAYSLLLCDDPSMPMNCPADLVSDGWVDDSDFILFAAAYDKLDCPE